MWTIPTHTYYYLVGNKLYHSGILGQKWGVRRFQNKDGSLTAAGKERYGGDGDIVYGGQDSGKSSGSSSNSDSGSSSGKKNKPQKVKNMSDDEIRSEIARIQLENQLKDLRGDKSKKAKDFIDHTLHDIVDPSVKEIAKTVAKDVGTEYVTKVLKDKLGLNAQAAKSTYDTLKEEYDTLKIQRDIADLKAPKSAKDTLKEEYDTLKIQRDIDDLKAPKQEHTISDFAMDEARRAQQYSEAINKADTAKKAYMKRNGLTDVEQEAQNGQKKDGKTVVDGGVVEKKPNAPTISDQKAIEGSTPKRLPSGDGVEVTIPAGPKDSGGGGKAKTAAEPTAAKKQESTKSSDDGPSADDGPPKRYNRATDDNMAKVAAKVVTYGARSKLREVDQHNPIRRKYQQQLAEQARQEEDRLRGSSWYQKKLASLPGKDSEGHVTDRDRYTKAYNELEAQIDRNISDLVYGLPTSGKRKKK